MFDYSEIALSPVRFEWLEFTGGSVIGLKPDIIAWLHEEDILFRFDNNDKFIRIVFFNPYDLNSFFSHWC